MKRRIAAGVIASGIAISSYLAGLHEASPQEWPGGCPEDAALIIPWRGAERTLCVALDDLFVSPDPQDPALGVRLVP